MTEQSHCELSLNDSMYTLTFSACQMTSVVFSFFVKAEVVKYAANVIAAALTKLQSIVEGKFNRTVGTCIQQKWSPY